MKPTKILHTIIIFLGVSAAHANANNQIYGAIEGGVLQAQFNTHYQDQTDLIPQNISNPIIQNGYTAGAALGYVHAIQPNYFLGLELRGNKDTNHALFQSGSANTAFSDQIEINHHYDLTVTAGIKTQSAFSPYLKLGISYASIQDYLTSPVGYNPIYVQYNAHKNVNGFVGGIGVNYMVGHVGVFIETDYHDYGNVNFTPFQNFSADYTHAAHLYSYSVLLGILYAIDIT